MGLPNQLQNRYDPQRDLPDLEGKIIFITGGTAGLGCASMLALAKHNPAHIYFTGRNSKRGNALIEKIKKDIPDAGLTFVECDFESLGSIRAAMVKFTHATLDILMCNAGIMAKPPTLSKDDFEIQFAVNHLAHALIIKLLLPALQKASKLPAADVRIVILTSLGWAGHPIGGIQFPKLTTVQDFPVLGPWQRYGQSKLANIVYTRELARRYPNITTVSVHPGVVKTELVGDLSFGKKLFNYVANLGQLMEIEDGALNQVWMAAGAKKGDVVSGGYYLPVGVESSGTLNKHAKSEELARELWDWTEDVLRKF